MKYLQNFFFFSILLLFASPLSAQFSVGLFGDLSNSSLSGNAPPNTEYNSLTALGGGLMLDYRATDEVTVSLQPMFLQKGATVSYDLPSYKEQRDSLNVGFSYFSIPIMVKVVASKVVYVSGGFEFDILQEAKSELVNTTGENDITEFIKSTDFSANFGVGFIFDVYTLNLFFELRYSIGLTNVSNIPNVSDLDIPSEFKNTSTQIIFGIMYPFGE
ncbi:MAG: porin family protein [Bacteroidota bacterium]